VRELLAQLPHESILYFGDTARVPYGSKSPETVRRYAREASDFLVSRDVKMVVFACNTATAHAFASVRDTLPVPSTGVIEPGARAAVEASRGKRVGVIGTAGTIASGAYDLAVRRLLPDARVYAQPCPLFVPLVEEGHVDTEPARLIAETYLHPLKEQDVDVLILGCTHYPLLRAMIARIMGPSVTLVDSAHETVRDVARILTEQNLLAGGTSKPAYQFIVSDSPLRFREIGGRFVDIIGEVEKVDVEGYNRAA
jgi:glutamate racemase